MLTLFLGLDWTHSGIAVTLTPGTPQTDNSPFETASRFFYTTYCSISRVYYGLR